MSIDYLAAFQAAARIRSRAGIELARCCALQLIDAALVCGDVDDAQDWQRILDALDGLEREG